MSRYKENQNDYQGVKESLDKFQEVLIRVMMQMSEIMRENERKKVRKTVKEKLKKDEIVDAGWRDI